MQLYSRIVANLPEIPVIILVKLVILVKTLANLLVKLTKIRLGGAMGGGLTPLLEPLVAVLAISFQL